MEAKAYKISIKNLKVEEAYIVRLGKFGCDMIESLCRRSIFKPNDFKLRTPKGTDSFKSDLRMFVVDFDENGAKEKAFRIAQLFRRKSEQYGCSNHKIICITSSRIKQSDFEEAKAHFDECLLIENTNDLYVHMKSLML